MWLNIVEKKGHRVHCTVDSDRIDYEDDPSSPSTSLLNIEIHLNITISDATQGARYATADIENCYRNSLMATFWCMRIVIKDIPKEIIT